MNRRSLLWRCLALAGLCVAGFAVGTGAMLWSTPPTPDWAALESATPLVMPRPELTPEQVVVLQVTALREFRTKDAALLQCMAFASPSNRAVTGAPPQFAEIVRRPKYRALIDAERALVGSATIKADQAMVMVTVVDAAHRASVFRFFLSKQTHPQFRDCWMTDSVTPDPGGDQPADVAADADVT